MRLPSCFTNSKDERARAEALRGGFTLLEVMISILILAVVVSTIYAAFSGTFRISKSTEYTEGVYRMVRITADRMLQDLESLTPLRGSYELSLSGSDIAVESQELSFVSSAGLSYTDGNATANAKIRYYLTKGPEGEGYYLWRSDTASINDMAGARVPRGFLLCSRVKTLRYTLLDSSGAEHESWDSNSRSGKDKAPVLVFVKFEFLNEKDPRGEPYKFMTRIAIPARG
jgi:general secretion pathway protein J